jgi:hypothetical protein
MLSVAIKPAMLSVVAPQAPLLLKSISHWAYKMDIKYFHERNGITSH